MISNQKKRYKIYDTIRIGKKSTKKYNEKTITIAASYKPGTDLKEGARVKAYLDQVGQSANNYIKSLIKADLYAKNIPYINEEP